MWGERRLLASLPSLALCFSASFQTFCLTVRAYFNTQKYGLFCSLVVTDGKDENGFKLEKIGPTFSKFKAMPAKITQNIEGIVL